MTLAGGHATVAERIKLSGIYHLASAGNTAAVVTIDMNAGAYSKVTVTVVDANGGVRWTANAPVPKWTVGYLTASGSQVALVFGEVLSAWSAKDGTPVVL